MINQISLKSIQYTYPGSSCALFNKYSTILNDTSIHAILGKSGSGKSTLIKILAGLLSPQTGSINISSQNKFDYHNPIEFFGDQDFLQTHSCLVPQFIEYENFSVQEYIDFGIIDSLATCSRINSSLSSFDTNFRLDAAFLSMNMNKLSGGQRKMLSLAKAMLIDRPLLLLDEPTSGVDKNSKYQIYHAMTSIVQTKFVIFSTHDKSYLEFPFHAKFNEMVLY